MNKTLMEKVSFACMVVFAAVMVGVVQISFVFLLISLSSVLVVRPAFGQASSGVRLEAGIAKEEADGDLKAAMTVYQQIAADSAAPRAVRAKALLRLARCDEKLGQQARQLYEQIVRDYADQPVAVQARTRLAAMKQQDQPAGPATMTVRKIEMPLSGNMGVTDTDGQRAVYRDFNGNLYFGDLAGRSKGLIFKGTSSIGWQPSRDFSSVLLTMPPNESWLFKFAMVNTDGSGFHEIPGSHRLHLLDWSQDKRYALAASSGKHNSAEAANTIVVLDVGDGSEHVITTTENNLIKTARFSPDGRFIAFSTWPSAGASVFVVPTQGGKASLLLDNAQLLDWTIDGRFLALSTQRYGADALSLLPMADGKSVGDQLFVRFGSFEDGHVTTKGSLVYSASPAKGRMLVSLANFDAAGRPGPWQSLDLRPGNENNPSPAFSPDGREIAYTSRNDAAGLQSSTLVLRSLSTGKEHEVYSGKDLALHCIWSAKAGYVLCGEENPGKTDFLSIAVDTGKAEQIGSLPGTYYLWQASPDAGALYLFNRPGPGTTRWEIATGKITAMDEAGGDVYPSRNGNWLLRVNYDTRHLEVRAVGGGNWRQVAALPLGSVPCFTPDSEWILYTGEESGRLSLFRVPAAGGDPERLGDYPPSSAGSISMSPDGKRVLAVAYQETSELSILENFVPKTAKASVASR